MKKLLAAALLVASSLLHAAPLCLPSSPTDVRVGVTFKADGSAAGAWAYWWCVNSGQVGYEWRAAPAASFTSAVLAQIRAYAVGANASFINTPTTLAPTDASLALMKADIVKATAADAGKPATPPPATTTWTTPAAGTFTLYTTANGKLAGIVAGRKATANAKCDATATPVLSGSSTYLPLVGASASEVTLCRKTSP